MKDVQKSVVLSYEKYKRLLDNENKAMPVNPEGKTHIINTSDVCKETSPSTNTGEVMTEKDILLAIPGRFKERASSIITFILKEPNKTLSWNTEGELIYDGKVIRDSHIADILLQSLREQAPRYPTGLKEFYKGVKKIHLPNSLIKAKRRKAVRGSSHRKVTDTKKLKQKKEKKSGSKPSATIKTTPGMKGGGTVKSHLRPPGIPRQSVIKKWITLKN